jgi:O-antigen ligase
MTVIFLMMAVVGVRIHEFFPVVGVIKPVLTLSIGGFAVLISRSPNIIARLADGPLSKLVYLYFGMIILTVPFASWRGGAFEVVQGLLPAILLFAAFSFIPPTRWALDRLQFGFVALVLFFAWYLQFFGMSFGGRLVSLSGSFDTNDVASVMALALPLAIGVMSRSKFGKERVGAILAVVALVLGIIATGSRGGFLALMVGAIVYVAGLKGVRRVRVFAAMSVFGAVFWVTAPPSFRARVDSLTSLENDYNTTAETGRKAVWKRARGYIRENPLIGVGAGNFIVAEGNFNDAVGRTGKWSATHNAYLQALAELGIPGGGVYIAMLLMAAWIGVRMARPAGPPRGPPDPLYRPEYLAGLCAFAMGATFLSHAYFTPQFGLLGFVALADRVAQAERAGIGVTDPAMATAPATPARLVGERGGLAWANPGGWAGRGAGRSMVEPVPALHPYHRRGGG